MPEQRDCWSILQDKAQVSCEKFRMNVRKIMYFGVVECGKCNVIQAEGAVCM